MHVAIAGMVAKSITSRHAQLVPATRNSRRPAVAAFLLWDIYLAAGVS